MKHFFPWFTHSRLFDLARQGQRLTPFWAALPLAFGFAFLTQLLAFPLYFAQIALYGFSKADPLLPAWQAGAWMAALLVGAFWGIFFFLWLWLRFYEKRPFYTLGLEAPGALKRYATGLLFGAGLFSLAVGLLALSGSLQVEKGDSSLEGLAALGGVLIVFLGWMVQGAGEEVLTRGWLLPVIGARLSPWAGVALSAGLFAALHSFNNGLSALALVNLLLFGLFAAFYALREGSLWGIFAIHSVWNWVQGNVFGLLVSGNDMRAGTLLNLQTRGPDWWTGGAFGPEGGLAVTLALFVGIVLVLLWPHKEETHAPIVE